MINLVDLDSIIAAYDSIAGGDLGWLLLHYADSSQPDDLSLAATGRELAELKAHIVTDHVFVAFYRQDSRFLLINYIPHAVSGVRRGMFVFCSNNISLTLS
jgi:hypothetical protein